MPDRASHLKSISESPLRLKMVFLCRYFSLVTLQCGIRALATMFLMLSPMARFYITENELLMYAAIGATALSYLGLICQLYWAHRLGSVFQRLVIFSIILHMVIEGFTIAVIATLNDLMFLLETYILHSFLNSLILYYTCQTRLSFNTCHMMNIFAAVSIFTIPVAIVLNIIFSGTDLDGILCVVTTSVILIYHVFAVSKFIDKLCPHDYVLAIINLQILPFNYFVFDTLVYKPPESHEN